MSIRFDTIHVNKGQTAPVSFQLLRYPRVADDITGWTLDVVLFNPRDGDELWSFDADEADVTIVTAASADLKWTPVDSDTLDVEPGEYWAQLRITHPTDGISYEPRDLGEWVWHVHNRATD